MKCVKVTLITFFIGILGISLLTATGTRIVNFGYQSNFYIQDDNNIWMFPSTIVKYQNFAFVESQAGLEGGDMWMGGINIPVSQTFILGVYLQNGTSEIEGANTLFPGRTQLYTGLDYNEAAHQFDVFGGFILKKASIGIHLSRYSSTETYSDPENSLYNYTDKLSELSFEGGISFKTNPNARFDGTIIYSTSSFASIIPALETPQRRFPEGYRTIGAGGRIFYAWKPKIALVPFAAYVQNVMGYSQTGVVQDSSESSSRVVTNNYIVGLAFDFIPIENNLVSLAAGVSSYTSTAEITILEGSMSGQGSETYTALPFINIALESRITKWLTARFSFYELIEKNSMEFPANETLGRGDLTGSSYSANFGLGFNLGRFTIDTLIDTDGAADFLHNGFYMISGKSSTNDLFTQVTVKYNFNVKKTTK